MDALPKDWELPESWARYGLPGVREIELRNKLLSMLRQMLEERGINGHQGVSVGAGCKTFIVTVTDPVFARHIGEIEELLRNGIPSGYSYELTVRVS